MHLPLIINVAALHREMPNDDLLLLDVRSQADYQACHIATALWFDKTQVNRAENNTSGLLPETETLTQALQTVGFQPHQTVVVYGHATAPDVGRVVWTLYAFGIQNIVLLDGGFNAWQAADLPITTQAKIAMATTAVSLQRPTPAIACTSHSLLAALDDANVKILDARTTAEYTGEEKRSTFGGHIPGAIHLPWQAVINEQGDALQDTQQLEILFADLGLAKTDVIYTYCQSHQRSAIIAVVLMHLGYQQVIGYPGAWSDWGNQAALPKA